MSAAWNHLHEDTSCLLCRIVPNKPCFSWPLFLDFYHIVQESRLKIPKCFVGREWKVGRHFFVFFSLPLSFVPFRDLTSFLLVFGAHVLSSSQIPWACFSSGCHGHSKLWGFFPSIYLCFFKWFTFLYLLEWWIFLTFYYLVLFLYFLHSLKPAFPLPCGC